MNATNLDQLAKIESVELAERIRETITAFMEENAMTIAIKQMQDCGVIKDHLHFKYEVSLLCQAWDRAYEEHFGNVYKEEDEE
jgi:hypothetical protein